MPERRVVIGSKVGLHARPAAMFVQAAAKQPVKVTIAKAAGGDPVDARSILSVLALDARGGDEVVLVAEGDGADEALDELAALVARDLDSEGYGMAETLSGIGVSPGVAAGPVAQMAAPPVVPTDATPSGDPESENQAAMAAMRAVSASLEERASRAPGEAASVLAAQAMMAEDPTLASKVTDGVQAGKAAVAAVVDAFEDFRAMLAAAGPYMAERVADLDDLRNRTVATLLGVPMPGVPDPGHPFVLVALDLAPADTATLDKDRVRAIITEEGGPTSHTAILAKSLGIPAVVTVHGATAIPEGETVLVDGTEGTVAVAPDEATVQQAARWSCGPWTPAPTSRWSS